MSFQPQNLAFQALFHIFPLPSTIPAAYNEDRQLEEIHTSYRENAPAMSDYVMNNRSTFEQVLHENLQTYVCTPDINEANLFQTHKEISIARYALSCQAMAYHHAMKILLEQLDFCQGRLSDDPKLRTDIMTTLVAIETKSKQLIQSAREVTELLGKAVEIDIDKGALRTLLINVPSIIEKSVTRVSGNPELAKNISLSVNNQISDIMIALRITRDDDMQMQQTSSGGNGIDVVTFQEMLNSVPSHADVREAKFAQPHTVDGRVL